MPVLPNLLLQTVMSNPQETTYWNEDDNSNDPFLGAPYQWTVQFSITDQSHTNHTTQTPYYFNGLDVQIGDWFASSTYGRAVVIREIIESGSNQMTCLVEDFERYNLYTDPDQSGYGLTPEGAGIIFRLGDDGLPVLGPIVQDYLPTKTVEDLMARFMARNGAKDFILVRQELHGMSRGDVIYADFETDFGYKKVDAANLNRAIGIVTETGVPGLHYFSYRPLGRLVNDLYPPLWGAHGDVFYLDPTSPGGVTNEKPAGLAIPVYLQLDLPTRAIQLERGAEMNGSGGAESETNKYDVTNVSTGQTTFTMPAGAKEVLYMAINGIENENFTFDAQSKVLVFDPVETGYGVDVDDEVFFIYKS